MASRRPLHRWALAVLLLAGPAAAAEAPRIAGVRPMPDRPYLAVDVSYPKSWPATDFTFEVDGQPAPSRPLGGGFDARSNQATYLVFPGAACKRLTARWGDGPAKRTAPARLSWKAPAFAILLGHLGEREALLAPGPLEFQVFAPATVRFFQDGTELEATPVETGGPGRRLRVAPRWRTGLNTIELRGAAPGGFAARAFTFVLLDAGGLAPGESVRLAYGEVGSRSGPFYELAIEGDAVAIERRRFAQVPSAADDGWVLADEVYMADLRARAPGEATLRIRAKGHFTEALAPVAEHRLTVAAPERRRGGLASDPVEDDPRHAEVFAKVDAEVDALLRDHPQRGAMGFCHVVWETKKRLLKEKYGIEWRSPDEMNPQVIFD